MIERMSNVTVVCLDKDRTTAVERLGELGAVHVVDVRPPDSEELVALTHQRDHAERALTVLRACQADDRPPPSMDGPDIVERVLAILDEQKRVDERVSHLRRLSGQVAQWGSFDRDGIERLRKQGVQVVLGSAPESALPELPDQAVFRELSRERAIVRFVVVAPAGVELPLESAPLPEISDADEIERQLDAALEKRAELENELDALAAGIPSVEAHLAKLTEDVTFRHALEGMGEAPGLSYLQGYVPDRDLERVRQAAFDNGWALRIEAADPDDLQVPTLLTVPKPLRLAKPIFDFIGILPAYSEVDVSGSVLVFLTIFFGMIIGDAGYGALFLVLALVLKKKVRASDKQVPLNLFLLMSAVTLVWGWLNGTWFAIPSERLPAVLRGLPWFTLEETKNSHIQWLCFVIGATHLSLARLWQALLRGGRRAAFGEVGWAMLIWGNFFTAVELIVEKGSFPAFAGWLYAVGLVLVLTCGVKWTDVGDVFNLPFGFIGSFVDVLSYIRLFAVGLSSYFIAKSFNEMGAMLVSGVSIWLLPAAILVILFGHLLNVALGFMGVLVHGIRLNTLEFSNHMGLTWAGRPFRPLRRESS